MKLLLYSKEDGSEVNRLVELASKVFTSYEVERVKTYPTKTKRKNAELVKLIDVITGDDAETMRKIAEKIDVGISETILERL